MLGMWVHVRAQVPSSPLAALPPSSRGCAGCKVLPLFTAGVLQGGGKGTFTEPCLHFWSFLRDTFSCASPAWNHLLPGGLRGCGPLFKHFSYVVCTPPGWRTSGAKGWPAGG